MTVKLPLIENLDVAGKRVLIRADLDVPIAKVKDGNSQEIELKVIDDARIREIIPTFKTILDKGCKTIVIFGHLGHETGARATSTFAVLGTLEKLLGQPVSFFSEALKQGRLNVPPNENVRVGLLENLRFYESEETNDKNFSEMIAGFGDIYINESFATSHRVHASLVGVPKVMREQNKPVAAGLRFTQEVSMLSRVLENPKRPLVVIIGGAKLESKLPVITKMEQFADRVLVGGKLPSEIAAEGLKFSDKVVVASITKSGKDIDEESQRRFKSEISVAETVVWGGPMGVFEEEENERGTKEIALAIADCSGYKVAGGGDTQEAIRKFDQMEKFDWLSIGGGAMLEFLATGTLPALEALLG